MPTETKSSTTTTAISQPKTLTAIEELKKGIMLMEKQFAMSLPSQIKSDRFSRTASTYVGMNPKLLACERPSLYGALMMCAQDGLLPDGHEAAIVPYKGQAKYMPMISGILKKVRNSGELSSIVAQLVYKNELDSGAFKYWLDSGGQHLEHTPIVFGDKGSIVGVYALAKTKDGAVYIETLTMEDIAKIKAMSRGESSPWDTWEEEMIKKSALRRLSKRLPMSSDIETMIRRDDEFYDLKNHEPVKPQADPKNRSSRLDQIIDSQSSTTSFTPPDDVIDAESIPQQSSTAQVIPANEVPI